MPAGPRLVRQDGRRWVVAVGGDLPLPEPSPHAVLDEAARAAYGDRAQELLVELDEAHRAADLGRVERLQLEVDALTAELARTSGLGGRVPSFPGTEESARTAARKAIKRALDEIEAADRRIGSALRAGVRAGVRTGYSCRYEPGEPGEAAD